MIDEAKSHKKFVTFRIIRCAVDLLTLNRSATLRMTLLLPANLEIKQNKCYILFDPDIFFINLIA